MRRTWRSTILATGVNPSVNQNPLRALPEPIQIGDRLLARQTRFRKQNSCCSCPTPSRVDDDFQRRCKPMDWSDANRYLAVCKPLPLSEHRELEFASDILKGPRKTWIPAKIAPKNPTPSPAPAKPRQLPQISPFESASPSGGTAKNRIGLDRPCPPTLRRSRGTLSLGGSPQVKELRFCAVSAKNKK